MPCRLGLAFKECLCGSFFLSALADLRGRIKVRPNTPAREMPQTGGLTAIIRLRGSVVAGAISAQRPSRRVALRRGSSMRPIPRSLSALPRPHVQELEQDKDVQEFKLLNIENDVFVLVWCPFPPIPIVCLFVPPLAWAPSQNPPPRARSAFPMLTLAACAISLQMRAHREEIEAAFTDSGTDSGVSSGSEDGSPRFADLEGAPAASEHPFGRAEDVAGGDAERISEGGTASAASGGGGSSSVSIATTELATDSIRSGRLEGGALAAALAAAVPREPALIRESCSGALAELLAGVSTSLRLPLVAAPRWERSLGESDGDSDHVGTPHAFTPEPPNVRCSPRTGQRAEDAAPAPWRNLAATPEAG